MILVQSRIFSIFAVEGRARAILAAVVGFGAVTPAVSAGPIVPFTEDFDFDAANWFDTSGANPVEWVPAGGPDGGAYVRTIFSFVNSLPDDPAVLFRGHDEFDSSGDAFVGDWITEGVSDFSFFIRHHAPLPLTAFTRFASPVNFPGAVAIGFVPVVPDVWTQIPIAIDPKNPQFITFEGTDFETVFSNIGNLQIGVIVPKELAGLDADFIFDLDKVSIIPSPAAVPLVVMGLLLTRRRRR